MVVYPGSFELSIGQNIKHEILKKNQKISHFRVIVEENLSETKDLC